MPAKSEEDLASYSSKWKSPGVFNETSGRFDVLRAGKITGNNIQNSAFWPETAGEGMQTSLVWHIACTERKLHCNPQLASHQIFSLSEFDSKPTHVSEQNYILHPSITWTAGSWHRFGPSQKPEKRLPSRKSVARWSFWAEGKEENVKCCSALKSGFRTAASCTVMLLAVPSKAMSSSGCV